MHEIAETNMKGITNSLRFGMATAALALVTIVNADTFQTPYNTGTSTSSISYSPVNIGTYKFDQIETGATHTVARLGNKIYTWGSSNAANQLGRSGDVSVPTQITAFEDINGNLIPTPKIVKVAAGDNFGVAIDENGFVYNWGTLPGNATQVRPHRQDWAHNNFKALDIAAGSGHGLILSLDNGGSKSLRGFGDNTYGEAGNWEGGTIELNGTYPLSIQTFNWQNVNAANIVSFSAGADHSVIALNDGSVISFGRNDQGELGYGTTLNLHNNLVWRQWIPATNLDGSAVNNAVQVAAGNGYTLVRTNTGEVLSVGNNAGSQLGRSGDFTRLGSTGLNGAVDLSAGYNFAMAKTAGGDVYDWGFHVTSNTTSETLTSPTIFKGFHDFTQIEAGNMPISFTGPWDSTFFNNGGGVTTFAAIANPVPVYLKTELYTSEGTRAGLDYVGGATGFVRIYSNISASDGNGPTFTPVSTSTSYFFSGSAKVQDGQSYVDVPLTTYAVTVADRSTFNVEQTNGNTITGKKINIYSPIADSFLIENETNPGTTKYKAGDVVRFSVHLPYAAGVDGYDLPFTSNTPSVVGNGVIHIAPGANTGVLEFTLPMIPANGTVAVTINNNGGAVNLIGRFQVKIK